VNLSHLKLFADLAETRSISKAAQRNAISQSAASQHLQELERQMQMQFVNRAVRPLVLTDAGNIYLKFCQEVLEKKVAFEEQLKLIQGQSDGTIRVASIYSVGLSDLARLEDYFAQRYPSVQLRVNYLQPAKVYEAIRQDRADLGLVSYPQASADLQIIPWRQERMAVAVAADSPLATRVWLRPGDLEGQEFIGFDDDLPIAGAVAKYLADAGVVVKKSMQFDNIASVREAVAVGSAFSILPVRQLKAEVEAGRIAAIRLDNPPIYRPLAIVHLAQKRFNRATELFLEALREEPANAA
jgi:LysR family transcriptional regulator, transcriptional activator of the cysJI operon